MFLAIFTVGFFRIYLKKNTKDDVMVYRYIPSRKWDSEKLNTSWWDKIL